MKQFLYKDELLAHIRNPKNLGKIKSPTYSVNVTNTSCGDEITLDIVIEKNKIKEIKHSGDCCAVSRASASMVSESLEGKNIKDILNLSEKDILSNFMSLTEARKPCALMIYNAISRLKEKLKNEK